MKCKDYTVSGETFKLIPHETLDMLVTTPQPDLEELPKYYESEDYISHTDASKSFTDKLYQTVKRYTLNQKVKLISSFQTEGKTLLDIGCGTGDFILQANKSDWKVCGVEPSTVARDIFRSKIDNGNTISLEPSLDVLINTKQKFDVITMWHVLEHVPNLNDYLSKLKQLLKVNGCLVVAVPNYKSYDAEHYQQFWAAYDVPRHLWHFSQKSIHQLFNTVTMKVVNVLPMIFDAFYVSLLSEKYKTGKTNFAKAFFIGLKSNLKARSTKEYSSQIYVIKNTA